MPTPVNRYRHESYPAIAGATGMLHRLTDTEAGLCVTVAPFSGAEITSIQARLKDDWVELLDRANDFTSCERWRGRAPWLWPAVGRSYAPRRLEQALKTGEPATEFEWECSGVIYPMPIHGFVMNREWKQAGTKVSQLGTSIECEFADDATTRRYYPFGFAIALEMGLSQNAIFARLTVEAANSNTSAMPFCIGNHISLRAPLTVGAFNEVMVFAPVRRVYEVTKLGLIGDSKELGFREGIPLADSRLHNLVVGHFPAEQARVRVAYPEGLEVEVTQRELSDGTPKTPPDGMYFVFYALPDQGLFCPEPWLGLPNALNTKKGLVELPPGQRFCWEMGIRVAIGPA